MKGIPFPQQTTDFSKPEGWTDTDCYSLPVSQTYYLNSEERRVPCLISCWQLTPEELTEIRENGGKIYLSITGTGMPPVSLQVESPFGEGFVTAPGVEFHRQLKELEACSAFGR